MLFKQSWVSTNDRTNIKWARIFHLYKGFFRKKTFISFFVKSSARRVSPPIKVYKGFKLKYFYKGDICRGLITLTKKTNNHLNLDKIVFKKNLTLIIKKKNILRSKYVFGASSSNLKRKKILTLFSYRI